MESQRTVIALVAALMAAPDAVAQLPRAIGTEIALSRPEWKLWTPDGYVVPASGKADLLVHFHGDPQTIWNNAAHAGLDLPVVTVNYSGLSSAYRRPFENPLLFGILLNDARNRLAQQPGFAGVTDWDRLAVSSFSAGYGAVREVLKSPAHFDRIDSLLAADSLYATTASDGTALDSQMADYKRFADRAAAGEKRFIFTHSEVPTFTYESTAETGDELLEHLGLPATPTSQTGLGPIRYYRKASRGGFEFWGARGADGDAHLQHLRYLGEWLDDLGLGAATLPADFNADGVVDAADYTIWRDNWPTFTAAGDADGDGFVGNSDYPIWAASYATREPDGARLQALPEPGAFAAACCGALAASRHRPDRPRGRQPRGCGGEA